MCLRAFTRTPMGAARPKPLPTQRPDPMDKVSSLHDRCSSPAHALKRPKPQASARCQKSGWGCCPPEILQAYDRCCPPKMRQDSAVCSNPRRRPLHGARHASLSPSCCFFRSLTILAPPYPDETKRLNVYARLDFLNSRKQLSCEFNLKFISEISE